MTSSSSAAAIDFYVELVATAFDSLDTENSMQRMTAYYNGNKPFAFAAALRMLSRIDISRMPARQVLHELTVAASTTSGELRPAEWYLPAIEAAQLEFARYTSYVDDALEYMRQYLAVNSQFERWVQCVKLTEVQSRDCRMWRRITTHGMPPRMEIIGPGLATRILEAKQPKLPPATPKQMRAVVLSSVRTFMEMTKSAVHDSLRASLIEAVQTRVQQVAERPRPTSKTAGAAELIPDFAPKLTALQEVCAW